MGFRIICKYITWTLICILLLFAATADAQTLIKLKVNVDGARVNATPAIQGKTLAKLPLETLLEASPKQGEWYPVSLVYEGDKIKGFIHEMLVNVISEEEWEQGEAGVPVRVEKTQEEIISEIEAGIEAGRELIRQKMNLEHVLQTLRPLIAKTFRISDLSRQRKLAAEIYLWIGMGYAAHGNIDACIMELEYMFEVDHHYALEITRNIIDQEIVSLIQHVEKTSRGEKPQYTLHVSTRPANAVVLLDGKELGTTPGDFVTRSPVVELEIQLSKHAAINETILLTEDRTEKKYELEVIGRAVALRSMPQGARVFLDNKEIAEQTNCILPLVTFGKHYIRIVKKEFEIWEQSFELEEGIGPQFIDVVLQAKDYKLQAKWGGIYDKLFEAPVGIALDKSGSFFIADNSNAKVKKFTSNGNLIQDWKLQGNVLSYLRNPSGIAIDSQGFIYVSDSRRHCIWKFYPEGKMSRRWGREGSRDMELNGPGRMAFDSQDNLYVIDSGNMRVIKFTTLGVVRKILDNPTNSIPMSGIFINSRDEMYLLDKYHVQKFSPQGELIVTWGEAGAREGQFNDPQDIIVDEDQFVYIADTGNKCIQKFDDDGNFICQWGTTEMISPMDLTMNSDGEILIVDRDANRVTAYRIPPEDPGR